jgi:hypothetical protein
MSRLGRGFPVQVRNVAAVPAAASGPQTWTGTDGTVLVTMASWGITNLTTNANIDTALDGVAAAGFNGITFWVGGTWDASGWNMYTDGQGRAWWTGTVWGSTFGTAWNGVDYIVAGCASRGLTATLSFNASNTGPDWEARTNAQMQTVGSTVATRYLSSPNIVWHVMFDDAPGATHTTASTRGQRAKAIFQGINGVEGTNTRVRWMEPARTDSNYATGWVTDTDIHVMNCWYDYGGNSTEIVEAGYTESGATTYPVGDCEPPYDGSPHYTGSRPQQLRERTYASFIEGGTYAQFGHEDWWPFGASGIYTESLTWSQVPTDAHVLEQGYAFGVINTYCANAAWEPDSTFVGSTVAGSGETKAASGSCGTSAVAYFPSSRTITVDTTVITGTGNVRLRWFDPVLNTYSSIAASEAQNATRSISYPSNHADGTSDFVLIVDNPDQTWTGTGATVTITATSGSFTPGGTATWTGNGATVTIAATSDAFAASGTAVWSSTDGLVTVTGTSSSFVGTGTTVWTGTDATVTITATSDAFTVGAATWTGNGATVTITATSDAFVPGAVTWAGNGGTVAIAGTSGVFTPGAVTWAGTDGLVTVTAASGSFGLGAGPQTWNGTAGTVAVAATSDAFAASGTIVWTGNGGTVTVSATSGAFSSGAVTWTGNAGTLAIAATSGAFTVAGTAAWIGAAATLFVAAQSGTFSGGAQFPFIRTGPLSLTKLDADRTLTKLDTDRTLEALE